MYKSWSSPSLFLPSHHISNSLITLLTLISGWVFFQRHAFDIWRYGRQDSHIFPVDDHVCDLFRHRVHLWVEVSIGYCRILSPHHFNRWDIDQGKGCFWFYLSFYIEYPFIRVFITGIKNVRILDKLLKMKTICIGVQFHSLHSVDYSGCVICRERSRRPTPVRGR